MERALEFLESTRQYVEETFLAYPFPFNRGAWAEAKETALRQIEDYETRHQQ